MSVLKILNNSFYNSTESFYREIVYILNPMKIKSGFIYSNGVYIQNPAEAAFQFERIYKIFGEIGRCIHHFIVSFETDGEEGYIRAKDALDIVAFAACSVGLNIYQYIMAVHENTDQIHVHIILNATSYVNGQKYYDNKENQFVFAKEIEFQQTMFRRGLGSIKERTLEIPEEEREEIYTHTFRTF